MKPQLHFVLAVLMAIVVCLTFTASGPVQAQKNCMTQQCTVVPYSGVANGGAAGNSNCVVGAVASFAYSDDVSAIIYGKNSIGGNHGPLVDGAMLKVNGGSDCPGMTQSSGTVSSKIIGEMSNNTSFPKTCVPGD